MQKPRHVWQEVYQKIEESQPKGITVSELMAHFGINEQSVYGHVYAINKKSDLKKVISIKGRYLFDNKLTKFHKTTEHCTPAIIGNNNKLSLKKIVPDNLLKIIPKLTETDRNDFNDLLKKSYFYGRSAIALLEAYQFTSQL